MSEPQQVNISSKEQDSSLETSHNDVSGYELVRHLARKMAEKQFLAEQGHTDFNKWEGCKYD